MLYKCANAYYFCYINAIGGIESHLFYISQKYGQYDITIFYQDGDPAQIRRIKKKVRCVQIRQEDSIECENLFCCFNREIIERTKYKKSYLVLHGDYLDMVNRGQIPKDDLPIDERFDEYLGVSQLVCDSWYKLTGIKAKCVYEPVVLDRSERPLMLLSATRLTKEKGWDRMVQLAHALDRNGVDYVWFIFSDLPKSPTDHMVFMKPRMDITKLMPMFDCFVQLSDNEGFCLSVVEALMNNLPVICTKLPVLKELGLNKSNSIMIDFDMDIIPIEDIRNIRKLKFNYTPPEDKWLDVLSKKKNTYKGDKKVKIRAIKDYFDTYEKKDVRLDDVYDTTEERALVITGAGFAVYEEEPVKKTEEKPEKKEKKSGKKRNAVRKASD